MERAHFWWAVWRVLRVKPPILISILKRVAKYYHNIVGLLLWTIHRQSAGGANRLVDVLPRLLAF